MAGLYADKLFKEKKYLLAGKLYALSDRSFEEVVLKIIVHANETGLRSFFDA